MSTSNSYEVTFNGKTDLLHPSIILSFSKNIFTNILVKITHLVSFLLKQHALYSIYFAHYRDAGLRFNHHLLEEVGQVSNYLYFTYEYFNIIHNNYIINEFIYFSYLLFLPALETNQKSSSDHVHTCSIIMIFSVNL